MLPSIMCRVMYQALQVITASTLLLVMVDPSWGQTTDGQMDRSPRIRASLPVQQPLEGQMLLEPHIMSMRTDAIADSDIGTSYHSIGLRPSSAEVYNRRCRVSQ